MKKLFKDSKSLIINTLLTKYNYKNIKFGHATHMELNFPFKMSYGIEKLMPPHTSKECINLINLLLTYDPEKRINASQAL